MTSSYLEGILGQPAMLRALARGLGKDTSDDLQELASRMLEGDFDRVILTGMGG